MPQVVRTQIVGKESGLTSTRNNRRLKEFKKLEGIDY